MKNWILPAATWVAALVVGVLFLSQYETTAGARGAGLPQWPAASTLPRMAGRPTIVVFVHPKCACSRATATELAAVMADSRHQATVDVVVIEPTSVGEGWAADGTWERFKQLPRSSMVLDRGGIEAARFGARTSGYIVAYDAAGRLRFSGGITASRGHAGDNANRRLLLEQLARATAAARVSDVFGCGLGDGA